MFTTDPITGQPRIVSPVRAQRLGPRPEGCPFCVGNEEVTPPEVDRFDDGEGGWCARVVPNLFPLTDAHEVIIMTSRHATSVRELTLEEWRVAVAMWQRRVVWHNEHSEPGSYVHLFVNDGRGAGASLEHTHAQLVVLPSTRASEELVGRARDAADCAVCDAAGSDDDLQVWCSDEMVVRAAHAPRTNEGMLLMPLRHETDFPHADQHVVAAALHAAVAALPEADFNCWLVQHPAAESHWYIEFAPRTSTPAGVEMALGVGVSIVDPAEAARRARERLGTRDGQLSHP